MWQREWWVRRETKTDRGRERNEMTNRDMGWLCLHTFNCGDRSVGHLTNLTNLHHRTGVTTLLIQQRTGQTVKATCLWTGTFETESCCGMKWGVCVCVFTSKTSFQQSCGSDSLLPRPLILLKAPPILSIHVYGVIFAQRTLALTHKQTHRSTR